jgi:hypothetical protein
MISEVTNKGSVVKVRINDGTYYIGSGEARLLAKALLVAATKIDSCQCVVACFKAEKLDADQRESIERRVTDLVDQSGVIDSVEVL